MDLECRGTGWPGLFGLVLCGTGPHPCIEVNVSLHSSQRLPETFVQDNIGLAQGPSSTLDFGFEENFLSYFRITISRSDCMSDIKKWKRQPLP